MDIFELPHKSKLVYLDMQVFQNTPKPGVAGTVIKVQYKVKRGKMQSFIVPVTSDARNIYRNAKNVLGEELGAVIKSESQELRKRGIGHYFGFRQVRKVERVKEKKGSWAKWTKKSDPLTYCWVVPDIKDGEVFLDVKMTWGDSEISVRIKEHRVHENEKASKGIGYWNSKQELIDSVKELRNENEHSGNLPETEGSELQTEWPISANSGGTGRDEQALNRKSGEESILQSEEGSGTASVLEQAEPSIATPANEELADAGRNRETSGMGADNQAQVAEPKSKRRKASSKGEQFESADSDYFRAIEAYERQLLDQFASSPFAAEPVKRPIDLGTAFSVRDRI